MSNKTFTQKKKKLNIQLHLDSEEKEWEKNLTWSWKTHPLFDLERERINRRIRKAQEKADKKAKSQPTLFQFFEKKYMKSTIRRNLNYQLQSSKIKQDKNCKRKRLNNDSDAHFLESNPRKKMKTS